MKRKTIHKRIRINIKKGSCTDAIVEELHNSEKVIPGKVTRFPFRHLVISFIHFIVSSGLVDDRYYITLISGVRKLRVRTYCERVVRKISSFLLPGE